MLFFLLNESDSNIDANVCVYPRIPKCKSLLRPTRWLLPNLVLSFNDKSLKTGSNFAFFPLASASTFVVKAVYPRPELITMASINLPFSIIDLTIAPLPVSEVIFNNGGEE